MSAFDTQQIIDALDQLDHRKLSVEEQDALHERAGGLIARFQHTPVYLLRAALDEAEGEGSLHSQGATYAAQAIDATYPEWSSLVERLVDELSASEGACIGPVEKVLKKIEAGRRRAEMPPLTAPDGTPSPF